MSGNHRTDPNTISILRTATLNKTEDIRRNKSLAYRVYFFYLGFQNQVPYAQKHQKTIRKEVQDNLQSK